ncbi:DNA polymerase [Eubacterium limosum]|uniref:DNA polymerase n=1 Tax=Eubacterium limosum TaxID=1736 RepID=UPI003714E93D
MEKRILSVDIETYSSVDLGECGVYPYVEAPDFQILLFAYAFDDEPVRCIDLYHNPLPERLRVALTDPNIIKCAFNANFERTCLGKYLETRMLPEQWRCTMVKALTLGLPGSLGKVALAMGLPEDKQKDKEGKALIRYFSIPCKPTKANGGRTRNLPEHDPVKWDKFIRYCIQDVEVERGIREKLSAHRTLKIEHEYWCLDQDINDRGINLDMPLIEEAIHTDAEIKKSAFAEIQRLTGVENPNSRVQIKEWVEKQLGRELEKFDKEILADLEKELPDGTVKRVIYLRQLTTKTSVKKYEKMKMYKCSDGRARGTMQFYGASRTGRFAGRGIQLQNLAKNHMDALGDARYLVRSGDVDLLSLCYDNIPDVLSQLVRTALIPSEGCRFIVSDFSSIEARVIAWLAGEQWRLKVFEEGGDIYCASASQMFGVPVIKHGINGELRQKGKIAELACGYGGGVGSLKAFGADKMGLSEDEMQKIITDWRLASPHITKLWWGVDRAAKKAILNGKVINLQYGLRFACFDNRLFIQLPSKRSLAYMNPRILPNRRFGKDGIVYDGIQQQSHKWGQIDTYGPKLVENIVQAIARDCLLIAMKKLDDVGFKTVSHVHDEVILDVPKGIGSVEEVGEIMGQPIDWAPGLLLRADGYECNYYMKD